MLFRSPSRVAAACRQVGDLLTDGDWHAWRDIVAIAATAHQLQPKTVDNLIRGMIGTGCLERRGRYRYRHDARRIRLAARTDRQAA